MPGSRAEGLPRWWPVVGLIVVAGIGVASSGPSPAGNVADPPRGTLPSGTPSGVESAPSPSADVAVPQDHQTDEVVGVDQPLPVMGEDGMYRVPDWVADDGTLDDELVWPTAFGNDLAELYRRLDETIVAAGLDDRLSGVRVDEQTGEVTVSIFGLSDDDRGAIGGMELADLGQGAVFVTLVSVDPSLQSLGEVQEALMPYLVERGRAGVMVGLVDTDTSTPRIRIAFSSDNETTPTIDNIVAYLDSPPVASQLSVSARQLVTKDNFLVIG